MDSSYDENGNKVDEKAIITAPEYMEDSNAEFWIELAEKSKGE